MEDSVGEVSSRKYSEVQRRALQVLDKLCIECDDVLFVLAALPQPRNTRRIGVIPTGQSYVNSQAVGLTTQHNAKPACSSLSAKCPLLVRVLSRFACQHDSEFTFTTITLNYNYAAAPHRDVNHDEGKARIIALGNFTGGSLQIETIGEIDIHNKWFDFDGRLLHHTNPFEGERYSLVYFSHLAYKDPCCVAIMMKLRGMGIPWPRIVGNEPLPAISYAVATLNSAYEMAIPEKKVFAASELQFLLIPSKLADKYHDAYLLEINSLVELLCSQASLSSLAPDNSSIILRGATQPQAALLAKRAVTFTVWKVVCEGGSVEEVDACEIRAEDVLPRQYCKVLPSVTKSSMQPISVDVVCLGGGKLTISQKRKLLTTINLRSKLARNGIWGHSVDDSDRVFRKYYIVVTGISSSIECSRFYITEQIALENDAVASGRMESRATDDEGDATVRGVPHNQDEIESEGASTNRSATPLKGSLCLLMLNLAKAQQYDIVYDPFCGSGSILSHAHKQLNCICFGSDVQLSLPPTESFEFETFISNIYHDENIALSSYTPGLHLDAIICDPPYGRREKHTDRLGNSSARHNSAEERAMCHFQVLAPLLLVASCRLRIGGRLVFLFINFPNNPNVCWDAAGDLALQPNLRIVGISREFFSSGGYTVSRDIVIIEKHS